MIYHQIKSGHPLATTANDLTPLQSRFIFMIEKEVQDRQAEQMEEQKAEFEKQIPAANNRGESKRTTIGTNKPSTSKAKADLKGEFMKRKGR